MRLCRFNFFSIFFLLLVFALDIKPVHNCVQCGKMKRKNSFEMLISQRAIKCEGSEWASEQKKNCCATSNHHKHTFFSIKWIKSEKENYCTNIFFFVFTKSLTDVQVQKNVFNLKMIFFKQKILFLFLLEIYLLICLF